MSNFISSPSDRGKTKLNNYTIQQKRNEKYRQTFVRRPLYSTYFLNFMKKSTQNVPRYSANRRKWTVLPSTYTAEKNSVCILAKYRQESPFKWPTGRFIETPCTDRGSIPGRCWYSDTADCHRCVALRVMSVEETVHVRRAFGLMNSSGSESCYYCLNSQSVVRRAWLVSRVYTAHPYRPTSARALISHDGRPLVLSCLDLRRFISLPATLVVQIMQSVCSVL